ncbi:acyltransferase domain-containing protein, partial [Mycobacterium sp. E3339]|uniref:acyltransferase domain-containing protein n=1 Tax=Mycobacterium sp. E3339 TaxID=1834146 RepID=UPI000A901C7E
PDPTTAPTFDAQHWATNMRNPVHFQQAITHAGTTHHTFIEISPHPLLTQAILDTLRAEATPRAEYLSIGTLQRDTDDTVTFRTNLYAAGAAPQTPHPPEPHPQIPTTPWHHTRHWVEAASPQTPGSAPTKGFAPQSHPADGPLDEWSARLAWPARPLPPADPGARTESGRWLVIADTDLAAELSRVAEVQAADADPSALGQALGEVDYVLYAPPAPDDPLDVGDAYQLFHQVRRIAAAMAAAGSSAKLFIVTRNAQPITEGDRANPSHGA